MIPPRLTITKFMHISEATLDDIDQLVELLQLLFSQEADFIPNLSKQYQGLQRIINSPETGRILVCHEASAILGMVNLLFTISTAEGGKVAILEDMVVHPEHRSSGIGGQLLDAAIEYCRTSGCSRITLLTDRDNASAMRFYARKGFEKSAMIPLRLQLAGKCDLL